MIQNGISSSSVAAGGVSVLAGQVFNRARPEGRDRREGPSGALESAQAVSKARTRKGDVSHPERSRGRVTATAFLKQKIH